MSDLGNDLLADRFLRLVWSFRYARIFQELWSMWKIHDNSKYYNFLLEETKDILSSFGIKDPTETDIESMLVHFDRTIQYARFDWNKVWKESIEECHDNGKPVLKYTHSMPAPALASYAQSMEELHESCTFDFTPIAEYIQGESILDVGCGSGWFMPHFFRLGAIAYTGIDRPEIMTALTGQRLDNIGKLTKEDLLVIDWITGDVEKLSAVEPSWSFGTIWLSEVLHSKKDVNGFLITVSKLLKPDSVILINSLRPGTTRSAGFNTQMLLHAGITEGYNYIVDGKFDITGPLLISRYHHVWVFKCKH